MANFIVLPSVLMCITVSVNFVDGSTLPVRRVVNVGDDLKFDCVTDCNPNITLSWYQTKLGSSRYTYIASAGPRNEEGHISQPFHNKSRFSYSYENGSCGEQTIGLALHISNILEEDSANYTCTSYDSSSLQTEYLYTYDISAIGCTCSVGLNVVCVLLRFNVNNTSLVSLTVDGITVTEILKNNRFEFSAKLLNESSYDHSIEIFSPDDILSNVTCTLPIQPNPFPEDTTNVVFSTTVDTLPTDAMSTFFFKDPQSSTERMTTFSSSQSNTPFRQRTTTVLPSQSNTPSKQRTTAVLPSSHSNTPSKQRTATVLPSKSHTSSRRRTTTVLPSQSHTPSRQRTTTTVLPSQSDTPSRQRTTTVLPSQSDTPSKQRTTTVLPSQSDTSSRQRTTTVLPSQSDTPSKQRTTAVLPSSHSNTPSKQRTTTVLPSHSNAPSKQRTTTVLPSSHSNTPSKQRTTVVLPSSHSNTPSRQRTTTTVLPSQSNTPSRQRMTTVLPSQSSAPSKQRTTTVLPSQSNTPSKQKTTTVFSPKSINTTFEQRTTPVSPTIELSSRDGILSNITCTLPVQSSRFPEDNKATVYSTQPNPSTKQRTTTDQMIIKRFDDSSGSKSTITIVLAASVSVLLLIFLAVFMMFVVSIWKQKFRSTGSPGSVNTAGDSRSSTNTHFSGTANSLYHHYESSVSMIRNAMHAEVDDNTLMNQSNSLHFQEASQRPNDNEVKNVLQVDKDADGCSLPAIRCKDTEGYVAMAPIIVDEDKYGYTLPSTTPHKANRTTSIHNIDDDYLVPHTRGCKAEMIDSSTERARYTIEEEEGYIVQITTPTEPADTMDESSYLVSHTRCCRNEIIDSSIEHAWYSIEEEEGHVVPVATPTQPNDTMDENNYLVPQ